MHPTTRCSAVNLPDIVKMLSRFRTLMEENACASLLVEQPIGVPVPVTSRSHGAWRRFTPGPLQIPYDEILWNICLNCCLPQL